MHNEDLSLAPHMQRAATAAYELKGRETVLIEPMQGSEPESDTGRDRKQGKCGQTEREPSLQKVHCSGEHSVNEIGCLVSVDKRINDEGFDEAHSWAGRDLIVVIS